VDVIRAYLSSSRAQHTPAATALHRGQQMDLMRDLQTRESQVLRSYLPRYTQESAPAQLHLKGSGLRGAWRREEFPA
jgi:hypothetical protein